MRKLILSVLAAAGLMGAAHAQTVNYDVDERHSFATFVYTHLGLTNLYGRFNLKDSTVQMDVGAKTGKADIVIDMSSVSTGFGTLDKHLNSDAVFDTAQFPTAKFVADKFSFEGDKVTGVTGTLTLKGKDYPVTLKANQYQCIFSSIIKRNICGGEFETRLDREVLGITFGLTTAHKSKDVRLLVQIEAFQL